jgi:hypothetical protein
MPITQAKTGHNAVAAVRARDAIGMTGDLAVIDGHRAKAGAINADHVMTIAGVRGTSGAAIRVVENLNAHRRRSWI